VEFGEAPEDAFGERIAVLEVLARPEGKLTKRARKFRIGSTIRRTSIGIS